MCGITGFLSSRPFDISAGNILESMMSRLHHRGPDGRDCHIDSEKSVAMGHTRLSIIDLDTGSQPLVDQTGQYILTVNGEFYDFKKIRTHLLCQGIQFKTKSDSEIALHLYQQKGLDFVNLLRGEFALALFNKKQEELILVRDRFGIKPLYFYFKDDLFVYGSEIKSILAHPQVTKEFCPYGALHQLMQTTVPGKTAFKNIYTVKPGHMIILKKKNDRFELIEKCYWDIDFPHQDTWSPHLKAQDYIEVVREEMINSVRLRLEADVPVACYLSGGIDSCSILGLASGIRQDSVKAFTIGFDHKDYDETPIAKEMAQFSGADQEILSLSEIDLYGEHYIQTLWHAERTFYNTLGVAKWHMSKRVRDQSYKVVITGEGSDELFGGYPFFKKDMFRHGTSKESQKNLKSLEKTNRVFKGAILSEEELSHPAFENLCGFTPAWIQPWMKTLDIVRPLLNNDVLRELSDYDPIEAIVETLDKDKIEGRHPLDKVQYTWSKTMLECQILTWGGDRVDMAHSVESRPAFLDHHVAEAAFKIPPQYRIKDNTEKWVLREAMKGVLPKVLYEREKFAFMAPPATIHDKKRQAVQKLCQQFLNQKTIDNCGLLDSTKVGQFIKRSFQEKDSTLQRRYDAIINHLLGVQVLHHLFIEDSPVKEIAQ